MCWQSGFRTTRKKQNGLTWSTRFLQSEREQLHVKLHMNMVHIDNIATVLSDLHAVVHTKLSIQKYCLNLRSK